MANEDKSATQPSHDVPQPKQTSLGLYVTAAEAYAMWQADPERVKMLDVRTVEEYVFIGHAPMAHNIPLLFPKYLWDAGKAKYAVTPNPDFVDHVKALFSPDDTILVTCRSGATQRLCGQYAGQGGLQQRLEHHRRYGRRHGQRSRKRVSRQAHEERLDKLRFALDL